MDPCTLSDDEIVEICQADNIPRHHMVAAYGGRKVVKLRDGVVVKVGLGVTLQEANAQRLAYLEADANVLRVPQVYRFFSRQETKFWSVGYLVMEYIDGTTLEHIDWEALDMLPRVALALNAIHTISGNYPGPISGGEAHGSLWSEEGSGTAFHNIQDFQSYLDKRLSYFQRVIHIQEDRLRFCHMDVAPRNFMLDSLGRLCLIDWGNAGYYPRYFDLWSIDFTQHVIGTNFGPGLLPLLKPTPTEMSEVQKLYLIYRYNSCFAT